MRLESLRGMQLTFSGGITRRKGAGTTLEDVLRTADRAMYEAKLSRPRPRRRDLAGRTAAKSSPLGSAFRCPSSPGRGGEKGQQRRQIRGEDYGGKKLEDLSDPSDIRWARCETQYQASTGTSATPPNTLPKTVARRYATPKAIRDCA